MGPKTLCNACGLRYKSGRLVPEYRPAASPTLMLTKHLMKLRRHKELQRAELNRWGWLSTDKGGTSGARVRRVLGWNGGGLAKVVTVGGWRKEKEKGGQA
ncbi:hypothetical protein U1Q18_034843 [Sarracenia purpurea var. burkii]